MLACNVNVLHVAILAAANFLLSWLWYSPLLFAKPWMRALGIDPNRSMKDMTEEEKRKMPFLFGSGLVSSFLLVFGLDVLVVSLNATGFAAGAAIGVLTWGAFALTGSLGTLWEGRKPTVLAINNGLFALTHIGFAGILSALR